MTRKDYILIAAAIHDAFECYDASPNLREGLIQKLAEALKMDNLNFDGPRFYLACRGIKEPQSKR